MDGPENLSDVLAKMFTSRGWGRKTERLRLEAAWAVAVGAKDSVHTRVGAFRRGVLEVEVRTGVLMQELAQFRKRALLAAVRAELPGMTVTDLKFRAANW